MRSANTSADTVHPDSLRGRQHNVLLLHVGSHVTAVAVTGFTVTNSEQQLIYICSYPHSRQ